MRASHLSQKLKNVIMQILVKNRETRKVPKLKEILNEAIARYNKEQALKRKEKEKTTDFKLQLYKGTR